MSNIRHCPPSSAQGKVVLITGAAQRIGAAMARFLHQQGCNIIVHYHTSGTAAAQLTEELNHLRPRSALALAADLNNFAALPAVATQAQAYWGRLDALINNASRFYPTPIGTVTPTLWQDLFNSNVAGAFFLSQAAAPFLAETHGCIINITDVHAQYALKNYPIYAMAKASLNMMTQALAKELAPSVRVNAIAPGAILWPEQDNALSTEEKHRLISKTALKRPGHPLDIAKAAWFLLTQADYMTGQTLAIEGGRYI